MSKETFTMLRYGLVGTLGVFLFYITLTLVVSHCVEPLSWWQRHWGIAIGGVAGSLLGGGFFIILGGVGIASCGTAIGIGAGILALAGGLGGAGTGGIIDLIRNPEDYRILWSQVMLWGTGSLIVGAYILFFLNQALLLLWDEVLE